MPLNYPPLGYTGENVEGSNESETKPGIVRAATAAEAGAGTRNDVFISPATQTGLTVPLTVPGGGTGLTSATAHGVLIGEGTSAMAVSAAGTNGQAFLGSTGADPVFATLTTSTGVGYTTGAGTLAVDVKSGGFKINAASTGGSLVAQNSYTVTQSAQTSFALPATAAVGDMFLIASGTGNTSGWIITQGASQEIWSGTNHTTNGTGGTLAGAIHTSALLMCTVANTDFIVLGNTTGYTFT
jgi:hypothetical protein